MLGTRILSSLIILPPVVGAIWLGGYAFVGLVALFGAVMAWEFHQLSGASAGTGFVALLLGAATPILTGLDVLGPGGMWLWVVFAIAVFMVTVARSPSGTVRLKLGILVGISLVLIALWALISLRGDGAEGRMTIFWLIATIAATDMGAYFAGRAIGGPKLAPAISPNKTWAGLLGGFVAAGIVGFIFAAGTDSPVVLPITLTSAGLAVVAQGGDLFESWIKRSAGVKDSGNLIPGHGGVLDRVDGYLTAVPLVALIALSHEGSLLTWP